MREGGCRSCYGGKGCGDALKPRSGTAVCSANMELPLVTLTQKAFLDARSNRCWHEADTKSQRTALQAQESGSRSLPISCRRIWSVGVSGDRKGRFAKALIRCRSILMVPVNAFRQNDSRPVGLAMSPLIGAAACPLPHSLAKERAAAVLKANAFAIGLSRFDLTRVLFAYLPRFTLSPAYRGHKRALNLYTRPTETADGSSPGALTPILSPCP